MSSTISTTHPPDPEVRRVGLVDRAALHLGVALITWGRRSGLAPVTRERRASRWELHLAQLARDRDAQRRLLLQQAQR